ncbi:DUF2794 domain-containing protein [Alteraurantiacibacter aquimixticola]|uniref:DUF2794 domain-containing protein n=1 Tax=Alteraurantiacibacter aquimixticola TaxID=2489173 RepID=A0A4T3F2Z0_9SPHN|nr:DUF2794 domain-containing protein [Alteraurantiacibacter aquimixticola]TIX51606.1 DUF2794 domain-containing protein [Alteraurantiacibacter aquimixticola]
MQHGKVSALPGSNIVSFPGQRPPNQVGFDRQELARILDLYGRMVAAGEWRDYAMNFTRECASFAAFRRTADVPQMRLEKRPALRNRQGMWALFGEHGQVLKRGQELVNVLAPVERRLVKAVEE